jgi:hypothetical protein
MFPRAGDSHQVGGELSKDQFYLLMCWFPFDACEGGVRHLGLYTVSRNSIRHRGWSWFECILEGVWLYREEL